MAELEAPWPDEGPTPVPRLQVGARHAARLLAGYFGAKLREQLPSLLPIVLYLIAFQLLVLRLPIDRAATIGGGLALVLLGLSFFMEGLRLGLMPLGESIGHALPRQAPVLGIVAFAALLGFGATLAEPAIGVLKSAGRTVDPTRAPLLAQLLTVHGGALVAVVGAGVGLATVLGMLRFLGGWSLKPLVVVLVLLCLALTMWADAVPELRAAIGLAWDSGAVTTGPVTVPLVLALGAGVSLAVGQSRSGLSGFGVVTLASLFPVAAVLALAMAVHYGGGAATDAALAAADTAPRAAGAVLDAVRAIVPLCLFLYVVQRWVLRQRLRHADEVAVGVVFTLVGLALFNVGLMHGLTPLGTQVGAAVPGAFSPIEAGVPPAPYGPLFAGPWGQLVVIAFAFFLGFGATLAEPALNAMGLQVEEITVGAFRKPLLMGAVAVGVGLGLGAGLAKLVYGWELVWLLVPGYVLLLVLTLVSSEQFVNIGWDAAGVTTGPITVPLVIALGLSVGQNVPGASDGFGMLALASIGPILTVLSTGLWIDRRRYRAGGATARKAP